MRLRRSRRLSIQLEKTAIFLNWTDFFNIYVIVNKVVALSALFSDTGIADNDSARLPLHNRVVNDTLFIINDIK